MVKMLKYTHYFLFECRYWFFHTKKKFLTCLSSVAKNKNFPNLLVNFIAKLLKTPIVSTADGTRIFRSRLLDVNECRGIRHDNRIVILAILYASHKQHLLFPSVNKVIAILRQFIFRFSPDKTLDHLLWAVQWADLVAAVINRCVYEYFLSVFRLWIALLGQSSSNCRGPFGWILF